MSTATAVTVLVGLAVGIIIGRMWGAWKATNRLVDLTTSETDSRALARRLEQDNAKLRADVSRMLKQQLEL